MILCWVTDLRDCLGPLRTSVLYCFLKLSSVLIFNSPQEPSKIPFCLQNTVHNLRSLPLLDSLFSASFPLIDPTSYTQQGIQTKQPIISLPPCLHTAATSSQNAPVHISRCFLKAHLTQCFFQKLPNSPRTNHKSPSSFQYSQ